MVYFAQFKVENMNRNEKERLRIVLMEGLSQSAHDRMSGVLRFVAERKLPWSLSLFPSAAINNAESETEIARKADGIIITARRLSELRRQGHPPQARHIVVLKTYADDGYDTPPNAINLAFDNVGCAHTAAELLIKRGLGHFAYVHTPFSRVDTPISRQRGEAFRAHLADKGFPCAICARKAVRGNWTARLTHLAGELAALPHPCGVLAYNDERAREVIDACNLAGLKIPEQIQLVGVDNETGICENVRPRLTSIDPNFVGVGMRAAELLDELIRSGRKATRHDHSYGASTVVERDTTIDLKGTARLVTAAQKLIREQACRGLSPQGISDALKVSRRLLEMRFREVLDIGVAEAIRCEKLAEVCRRLKETNRPIGEISYACGFETPTHLKALFRKTFGMTMRTWRAQNSQK